MFRHLFNAAILAGFALLTRIELLPILAAVYVLASGSQWLSRWRRVSDLADENAQLRRMLGRTPTKLDVDRSNHRRSSWWLPVEWVATLWTARILDPLWRRIDARDDRPSRGRHAKHRWLTNQIHGSSAQRRPSIAAGQQVVARSWLADSGEQPVVTDEQIHGWLAEGVSGVVAHP